MSSDGHFGKDLTDHWQCDGVPDASAHQLRMLKVRLDRRAPIAGGPRGSGHAWSFADRGPFAGRKRGTELGVGLSVEVDGNTFA